MKQDFRVLCSLLLAMSISYAIGREGPHTPLSPLSSPVSSLRLPAMEDSMYYPDFWIGRCPNPNEVLMTPEQIARYNQQAYRQSSALVDLRGLPATMPRDTILELLKKASPRPRSKRFHADGQPLSPRDLQGLMASLNPSGIAQEIAVGWGLVVRRTSVRTFPTAEIITAGDRDPELDRFQETGLSTGEPLAILHETRDASWYFVQCYHYCGWIVATDVALGSRETVLDYATRQPRLVITGARATTPYTPKLPQISRHVLDMGDSLPLATTPPREIDRMGIPGNWVILLPTRTASGTLSLQPALISRNQDVQPGYLPFTRANIIRQAFKLQGERYGWGDAHGHRDCTGFIISVFRSFGLVLPRNSSDQMTTTGLTIRLKKPGCDRADPARLNQLRTGDVFESPTHAMLYLGSVGQEHYVIHDTLGASFKTPQGTYEQLSLRQITVTPLLALTYRNGRNLADSFDLVRRFVLAPAKHD